MLNEFTVQLVAIGASLILLPVALFYFARFAWRLNKTPLPLPAERTKAMVPRLFVPILMACVVVCSVLCLATLGMRHLSWFLWAKACQDHVDVRQRELLYKTDHKAVLKAGRDILANTNAFPSDSPDNETLPEAIRKLKPSYVFIYPDRTCLDVEMGGGFYHFGYFIFPDGVAGSGTKELLPGLWYNTENGRIPSAD